jgi:hypothetical protein
MILYDWLGIMAIITFVVCGGLLYEIADRVRRATTTEVGPAPATIPRLWRRWLGHENIQPMLRYTEPAPDRSRSSGGAKNGKAWENQGRSARQYGG